MTLAEHNTKLKADGKWEEYVALKEEREMRRQEEIARLRESSKPLVEALHAAGFFVNGVWDFVNTKERYDAALPVLAQHLELDYPPEIQEGIARAMAVSEARPWRAEFIRLIQNRSPMPEGMRDGFREGLALAIANTTCPDNIWETIELLSDPSLGTSRVLMLSIFGKAKDEDVKNALLELRKRDSQLAQAISNLGWVKKLDRENKQPKKTDQKH